MVNDSLIDVTPSPRLLQVLGDIPLQPWQCLAELIDNSLDEIARSPETFHDEPLKVEVFIEDGPGLSKMLVVRDNGLGMSREDLEIALRAGATTKARYGTLGLFGMGFNIATARLGTVTTVSATRKGDTEELSATIDFAELQRRESFKVPLNVSKTDASSHGTTVKIKLKSSMVDAFSAKANLKTLRNQLGDVYSYLLRDSVPGLKDGFGGVKVPAVILVDGEPVEPKIPCILADHRQVMSYGQPVEAVQYIDRKLTEATACMACGYWDRGNGPEQCEECGSTNLKMMERRVWGWIGIQRYLDPSHYGLDFIRFGRKILKQDKDIFKFEDVDTLQVDVEYPIEMPANRGRIVGEIHLDHVPVTYQKNAFDTQHRDWMTAREIIRGSKPLKPRSAGEANSSPLALLFSAFRRNDPGLRCLTPGDGKVAIHSKAKEWAGYFERGVPQYMDDTEWFESARRHDEIKAGAVISALNGGQEAKPPTSSGLGNLLPPKPGAVTSVANTEKPKKPKKSRDEAISDAMTLAVAREDLSADLTLKHDIGSWTIRVFETTSDLTTPGGLDTPVTNRSVSGSEMEILVAKDHPAFREFGLDVRQVAFYHAADLIHQFRAKEVPVSLIFSEMILQVEDLRTTPASIQERIEGTLERVRHLMLGPVSEDAASFWELMDSSEKQRIEEAAAVAFPNVEFRDIVASGEFVLVAGGESLAKFVAFAPTAFFDGEVFRAAFSARDPRARERIVSKASRALESLGGFIVDPLLRQNDDLKLAQVTLDSLESQLRSEEAAR